MPESFLERYPFMLENKAIGTFTITLDQQGEYVFELDVTNDSTLPWGFRDYNSNEFISKEVDLNLHRKIIKNWLEERVFPPERQNADEILDSMGLTKYDLLDVLKYNICRKKYDNFWIQFHKDDYFIESNFMKEKRINSSDI